MTEAWYVINSYDGQEFRVRDQVAALGFQTYAPRCPGGKGRLRPLFPSYLFVHFDSLIHDWWKIRFVRGVLDILRHGNRPLPLPIGAIEFLQSRPELEPIGDADEFVFGDSVIVHHPQWGDLRGIYQGMEKGEAKILLYNLFNSVLKVSPKLVEHG